MSEDTEQDKGTNISRWIMVGAGVIALAAVGIAVFRPDSSDTNTAPIAANSSEQAPPVGEVIAALEKKLQENPDDAEGWRMLGWSFFETSRFAEAATAMKRATNLDPDNAEYHSMLGEALVLASDAGAIPADARAAFNRALELDPKDPRARYFQAAAMDMDGQHEAAINSWFALLADTPADAPWAEDVRNVIRNVGKERGIEVEQRLASTQFAPPTGGLKTDGVAVASSAIPGPSRDQMQAASALPQGQQEEMIRGMVDGLADKLAANPDNPDGWIMLMRSRMQLGETGKAAKALQDASTAFRNDGDKLRKVREAAAALSVPGA
ncbi:tetratricopeptide repeat protein [Alterisphingorhabdus coralli]|uniref:Tetratricopeptide repeat protein n=1 Tax=Alterisphingorhabdus coralli TaxID=3071408 RepID=A0AA97FAB2_9SPHN|nr:tetratricopeptide repeat protein [Parasphingorhabdus sp. SCSIO 66989]WOE76162.1 tetratricopeptide repeat protein [Parasphingorhabdus sp. SCSIO 66989]